MQNMQICPLHLYCSPNNIGNDAFNFNLSQTVSLDNNTNRTFTCVPY